VADTKGLKRICMSCGARFYDMNRKPIICPACGAEFTGEIKVKNRRSRAIAEDLDEEQAPEIENDTAIETAETEEVEGDDTLVSLDDLDEGEEDIAEDDDIDMDDDLDIDVDEEDLDDDIAEDEEEEDK